MKKRYLLIVLLLAIFSCSKEDSPTPKIEGVIFSHSAGTEMGEMRFTSATRVEFWANLGNDGSLIKLLDGNFILKDLDLTLNWDETSPMLAHVGKNTLYLSSDPPESTTLIKMVSTKGFNVKEKSSNSLSGTEWFYADNPENPSNGGVVISFVSNYQVNYYEVGSENERYKYGEFIYHLNGNNFKIDVREDDLVHGSVSGNELTFVDQGFERPFIKK